jgi:prevent-host-death family protein
MVRSKKTDVSVADAKARLSELVEQAANGEEVIITKRGKAVAALTAVKPKRKRVDAAALRRITDQMPFQDIPAGEFVRAMRDSDRY